MNLLAKRERCMADFTKKIFVRCYCIFNIVLKIVARHAYQIGKKRVLETYYSTAKIHVEGLTFYISYNRRCASLHVIMFYSLLPSRGKCQKWLMQVWYLLLCVSFVDEMLLVMYRMIALSYMNQMLELSY